MKAILRAKMPLLLGTLLLAAHTAPAFYNPQPGRWLNRDPHPELEQESDSVFLRNAAVDAIDSLGLHRWTWDEGCDGKRKAVWTGDFLLLGQTDWELSSEAQVLPLQGCRAKLITSGRGSAHFWYSTEWSKGHEQRHVDIVHQRWEKMRALAMGYEVIYRSPTKAECYARVINGPLPSFFQTLATALNWGLDCKEYRDEPMQTSACGRYKRFTELAAELAAALRREISLCDATK
jgi:hypothetical protein